MTEATKLLLALEGIETFRFGKAEILAIKTIEEAERLRVQGVPVEDPQFHRKNIYGPNSHRPKGVMSRWGARLNQLS